MQLPITARLSARSRAIIVLTGLLCLAAAVYEYYLTARMLLTGFMVVFGLLALLTGALRPQASLIVTTEAISGRLLRGTSISWDQIEGAWVRRVLWQPYLCLRLHRPEPYAKLGDGRELWFLTCRARTRLFGDLTLDFLGLTPSARVVALAVNDWIASRGLPP